MKDSLKAGDSAIDATAGTGEDTCLLADCVGPAGRVYAFDIQKEALKQTRDKLEARGLLAQTRLFHQGHETLEEIPELAADDRIAGVMFNLGYLPGGDPKVATEAGTTLRAVQSALGRLRAGGVMTLALYRHPGGDEESRQVEAWASALGRGYNVHKIETINKNNPPYLIVVEKTE